MSTITLTEHFRISDVLTDVTSVVLSDPTGTYGVKRNDTDEVVVADAVEMTNSATGTYTYTFTEPAEGLTYTYWVEWVYGGETFRDEHEVTGTIGSDYHSTAASMRKEDIVGWLAQEFKPLTLATPAVTLRQIVDNAVRYWNTHSGYKIREMVVKPGSGLSVQLSAEIKTVVQVYPATVASNVLNQHPLWTMLGVQLLDNVTSDLIMLSEAFRNYQIYIGTDFRWTFEKSEDPLVGGYLYVKNPSSASTYLCVEGTKRIVPGETIKQEYILDWVLDYSKALLKEIEGNTLRKSGIIDIKNDGNDLVREGIEKQKELKEQLSKDGRWVAIVKRA